MRIAKGATRTVLVGKRYTLKFPTIRRVYYGGRLGGLCKGYLSNSMERAWSGERGFNPVLFHIGPFFNVYRTCEPVMVADNFDYSVVCDYSAFSDNKPENLGIHPELGLVWIDYGS